MKVEGRQTAALIFAAFVAVVSAWQVDETVTALKYYWAVKHASSTDFLVSHWATWYTWGSALFAPFWLALSASTFFVVRRRPTLALFISAAYVIAAPISCAFAPSLGTQSGGPFGLEEVPFADAERTADFEHLQRLDQIISRRGESFGEFPTSPKALSDTVGDLAKEDSPYEQAGRRLSFDLKLESDRGAPYSTAPEKPGIVYYAVNPRGTYYVLTVSGLNAPISGHASMMRAGSFVGGKQPWGGLLAISGTLRSR